jgi:hypothetical protein
LRDILVLQLFLKTKIFYISAIAILIYAKKMVHEWGMKSLMDYISVGLERFNIMLFVALLHVAGCLEKRHRGRTKNIRALQDDNNPDLIIINLGDNMFNWNRRSGRTRSSINSNKVATQVYNFVQAIDNYRECIWIGPTYHFPGKPYVKRNSDVDLMYKGISKGLAGRCTLIDSRDTFKSTAPNDGLHLTNSESQIWGMSLFEKLSRL